MNEQDQLTVDQTKLMLDYARLVRLEFSVRDAMRRLRYSGIGGYTMSDENGKQVLVETYFRLLGLWPDERRA